MISLAGYVRPVAYIQAVALASVWIGFSRAVADRVGKHGRPFCAPIPRLHTTFLLALCALLLTACYRSNAWEWSGPRDGGPDGRALSDARADALADDLDAGPIRADGGPGLDASARWDARVGTDAATPLDGAPRADGAFDASPMDAGDDADGVTGDAGRDAGPGTSTIDWFDGQNGYSDTLYTPSVGMTVWAGPESFHMNDGSTWRTGGGSSASARMRLERLERVGTTIRYHMTTISHLGAPIEVLLWVNFNLVPLDIDAGAGWPLHSTVFQIDTEGPFVIEAEAGSTSGVLHGYGRVAWDPDVGDPRQHHLSAPIGAVVPFTATYTLVGGAVFDEAFFDTEFRYRGTFVMDLTAR